MNGVLVAAIVLALAATLIVLLIGVMNLFRKNHDPRTSNKLMRWRIILQATAVALIMLVFWLSKH
jgi:hypothetical protein